MKPKLVDIYSWCFSILGKLSTFNMLRLSIPKVTKNHFFVEVWVTANLILSILFLVGNTKFSLSVSMVAAGIFYGSLRVFELVIYQINVLLFDQYRCEKSGKKYKLRNYRRLVLLSMQNYVEILFWFASFYYCFSALFSNSEILETLTGSIYYSLVTMSTLGYGDVTPTQDGGYLLVIAHSAVGLFMTLMILARFISLLPKPESMDECENDGKKS